MKITNNIPKIKTVELQSLHPGDCFYLPHEAPERVQVVGYYDRAMITVHVTRLSDGGQNLLGPATTVIPVNAEIIINPRS